jgi:hypothetical protein
MADPVVRKRLADLGQEFPPRDRQTPEGLAPFKKRRSSGVEVPETLLATADELIKWNLATQKNWTTDGRNGS